jgi:amino acid transporter
VHRAWGPFIGWVNGWNGMMSSYINIGLLITLFPSYFPIHADFWERFALSVAFVIVTIAINIVGFRWVSRISGLIMIVLFLPFFCALGEKHILLCFEKKKKKKDKKVDFFFYFV